MIIKKLSKHIGASLLMLAVANVASAASVPKVVINGVKDGRITSADGSVLFTGVTSDPEGINRINAQLKMADKKAYLMPSGKFVSKSINIPVKFTAKVRQTQWTTAKYQVPDGNYVFILQVVDNAGTRTQVFEVPVGVGAAAAAMAPVAKSKSAAPRVAINFPKNGSTVKGQAVFSGVARDDGKVLKIIGTIMNAANGLYLAPNGQFGQRTELALQSSGGSNAQWTTPTIQLPPGDYVLAVRGADNDGQFSEWSQSRFKVVDPAPANNAAIVATQSAATGTATAGKGVASNGMPYCSNTGQDADGDGFGWENKASCVVAGSRADTHPNCASSGSDPDGDGFGWENEKSCIVVVHCSNAGSDPDGDGFGWENEKSCIVLQAGGRFPKCASAASDPDGDGYGWENSKTCLVN